MNKGKTPWFAKVRVSCPDCGYILTTDDTMPEFESTEVGRECAAIPFDCPRCAAHYTAEDFWLDHQDKLNRSCIL